MDDTCKRYEIGGKTYCQRKLVLGQVRQLLREIGGISFAGVSLDFAGLLALLGDRLPRALAVVLTEEGRPLQDKDLDALAREIEYAIDLEQALQVVDDFFACNPVSSVLQRMSALVGALEIQATGTTTGSGSSPASSPAGTSSGGTPSSGDTPPTSAGTT